MRTCLLKPALWQDVPKTQLYSICWRETHPIDMASLEEDSASKALPRCSWLQLREHISQIVFGSAEADTDHVSCHVLSNVMIRNRVALLLQCR